MSMNPDSALDRALTPHPAIGLAFRLESIITPLRHLIYLRFALLGAFFLPLHARLGSTLRRLTRLLTRLATGSYPSPRPARPGRPSGKPPIGLPQRHAWVIAILGYQAAGYASQLEHLLRDPATLAVLAAAPPHAQAAAARTLRPLCHMLGIPVPTILQPPPRPAAPPKPRPEKPPPPPPPRLPRLTMRDCLPRSTPRDMPFLIPPFIYRPRKKLKPA